MKFINNLFMVFMVPEREAIKTIKFMDLQGEESEQNV